MEDTGILDPNNLMDLYSLHFVFLPIIQIQLDCFQQGWAHHALRTENNRTPFQLWVLGLNQADPSSRAISGLNVSMATIYSNAYCSATIYPDVKS
jgi:hypothetical protein